MARWGGQELGNIPQLIPRRAMGATERLAGVRGSVCEQIIPAVLMKGLESTALETSLRASASMCRRGCWGQWDKRGRGTQEGLRGKLSST